MRLTTPEKSNARRAALSAAACALAVALASACSLDGASKKDAASLNRMAGETPRGSQPPRTGLPLPPVASSHRSPAARGGGWTSLDGRRASLEDYRGQVVVLDMYATYCPPCRDEIPHLVSLERRYGPQGFKVIGLNVGGPEDRAKVPAYVKQLDIRYELADPDQELVDLLSAGDTAIPKTFVFDREGRLVQRFTGYDQSVAVALERAVQKALAGEL